MIYLNPKGGLCNRFRVIGSAIKLGKDYGDSITIFWRKSSELGCQFEDLFEDITYKSDKGKLIIQNIDCPESELIGKIEKEIGSKNSYADTKVDVRKFQEDYINNKGIGKFLLSTCYGFYGFINEYDWIVPKKKLKDAIENVVQQFGEYCIGIHIRRTDHLISRQFSPDEQFIKKMCEEMEKNCNTIFYLATDDMEVRKRFLNRFGTRIVTNGKEITTRQDREGVEAAVVDLYALSRTQKIYGSIGSSFSRMASALGDIELECVQADLMEKLLYRRIIIYGAGFLGRGIYEIYHKVSHIVGWVDRDYERISNSFDIKVLAPDAMLNLDFDYVVIAVKSSEAKAEIKQKLLDMGIDSLKIVEEV